MNTNSSIKLNNLIWNQTKCEVEYRDSIKDDELVSQNQQQLKNSNNNNINDNNNSLIVATSSSLSNSTTATTTTTTITTTTTNNNNNITYKRQNSITEVNIFIYDLKKIIINYLIYFRLLSHYYNL